jgi:hypothetical protein
MTLNEVRRAPEGSKWRGKRVVVATAAIVFAGLVALGALTAGYAIFGFVILAAVALLANRATEEASRLARPVAVTERAGEPLEVGMAAC